MVAHVYNPSTLEVDTRGSGVQDHPLLQRELKADLHETLQIGREGGRGGAGRAGRKETQRLPGTKTGPKAAERKKEREGRRVRKRKYLMVTIIVFGLFT